MKVFEDYSKYYDLMYKDKDYASEVAYIDSLIKKFSPNAASLLNLGCGTGNHDFYLADKGYNITAVDQSEEMIKSARLKSKGSNPEFGLGDIRSYRSNKKFDAVISLFHVMSYQTSNEDLLLSLKTAKAHMKDNGVFIFDCWYGPGVLHDKPALRIKKLEDEHIAVERHSVPLLDINKNTVEVKFNVDIANKLTGEKNTISESHLMRYLFYPEMELMAQINGLKIIGFYIWMSVDEPTLETWYSVFVMGNATA